MICEIILALLFPPLGVAMRFGCGAEVCICLLLTLLGFLPGLIYALYVLLADPPKPSTVVVAQQQAQSA